MTMLRVALICALFWLNGCDCGGDDGGGCVSSADCAPDGTCVDGRCVAPGMDAAVDDGGGRDGGTTRDAACPMPDCGSSCCTAAEVCLAGSTCVLDLGPCTGDDDCGDDAYCEPGLLRCVPYGDERDRNDECRILLTPGVFRTRVQCEWTGPPSGDAYPTYIHASTIPLVVDFRAGAAPADPPSPSIVVVTGPRDSGFGVIRVLDGATCAQQATLADHQVRVGSGVAAGDLNGDGRPEIVAPVQGGGVAAWTWDAAMGAWRVLWRSADRSAVEMFSWTVSLADLDDDGQPEIVMGRVVYGRDGSLMSSTAGLGDGHCGAGRGYRTPGIAADVDLDDQLELVQGTSIWTWDAMAGDLVREPYSVGPGVEGPIAIADFGDYPGAAGDAPGRPEIAAIRLGTGSITTIGGEVVFGPVTFPGGGDGGNPTVADFDGDGQPEFATAGSRSYTVFDPDCLPAAARGGACGTGRTDGILWTQPIQENSCAIMGSTVFDFEGDGAAEVVYADECYARIFDGRDGSVGWSRRRSSATWIEGPTVADVDADFHAEMVVTATSAYRPSCPALDPIFPGLRCTMDDDCGSGGCVDGLCRCTTDAECGDAELACVAPLPGTPGMGNVCRASFAYGNGVRVYADVRDRWAGSRAIWNQHAYSVTNVEDDGTIPRGSMTARNWETAGLNNFRQNVQGGLESAGSADLTVAGARYGRDCSDAMPDLELVASVCNRATLGVPAGVDVVFYDDDPMAGGTEVCRTATTRALMVTECEEVSCTWTGPPIATDLRVHIRVDVDDVVAECLEGNNRGVLEARCPPPLM